MRNKIIFILIMASLITGTTILNKKIKNEVVSVEKMDFRNYKTEQVEELMKVEYEKLLEKERKEKTKRKREEVLRAEEEQRLKEEEEKIYCKFEVSFYTTAADEGSGTGLGASGEYVQPWASVAMPSDVPFYSTVHIEGLGSFVNLDTGNSNYINWYYDSEGDLVCRIDVCVSTKEEAFNRGLVFSEGYIILNN